MSSIRWVRHCVLIILSLGILLAMSSCVRSRGRAAPTTTSTSTSTANPQSETPVADPVIRLIDTNLLNEIHATTLCDQSGEADLICDQTPERLRLQAAVDGASYARWNWQFTGAERSLSGLETVLLTASRRGELAPNLYFVNQDGSRLAISLNKFGLSDDLQEVAIPLAEVRDAEGNSPDFSALAELQIVFEWAAMQGELTVTDLRFASRWEQKLRPVSSPQLASLHVPADFTIASIAGDLQTATQIDFTPEGEMLVSLQNGRIWWYHDRNADGVFDSRHLYSAGKVDTVGLLYDPVDGAVWIGGRGQIRRLVDADGDGVAEVVEERVTGLPWGRHQNNGMVWNPDPDPFSGESGHHWIYFGLGSTGDLEDGGELNSKVLRFPRGGNGATDLEVVSSGNRNPYMLVWAEIPSRLDNPESVPTWQLFASENGPDFNDAPDEVNHIRWQHHFGFPEQFGPVDAGQTDGDPYSGPLYPVTAHASASGLAYIDNPRWPAAYRTLYVSLFGQVFDEAIVGHKVPRIVLTQVDSATGPTYRGEPVDFITGLDRPLPMATDPNGDLLVADYASGFVYRVSYRAP